MFAKRSILASFGSLAVVLVLALAACTNPSATATMAPAGGGGNGGGNAGATTVDIANFAFSPASITVKVGTTITWTNKDSAPHTVTADDNSFDSGNMSQGQTYKHTFSAAGTFAYHCTVHPFMKATVVVTP